MVSIQILKLASFILLTFTLVGDQADGQWDVKCICEEYVLDDVDLAFMYQITTQTMHYAWRKWIAFKIL